MLSERSMYKVKLFTRTRSKLGPLQHKVCVGGGGLAYKCRECKWQWGEMRKTYDQKKRDAHKISARNSGGGNGCAQFYGRLVFFGSFCWKTPMPIKFRLLGGGGCWGFSEGGGWKCQYYFYGRGDFSDMRRKMMKNKEDNKETKQWDNDQEQTGWTTEDHTTKWSRMRMNIKVEHHENGSSSTIWLSRHADSVVGFAGILTGKPVGSHSVPPKNDWCFRALES